jgi:hypothetical protein
MPIMNTDDIDLDKLLGATDGVVLEEVRAPEGHIPLLVAANIKLGHYHAGAGCKYVDPTGEARVSMAKWHVDAFGQELVLHVVFREEKTVHALRLTFCSEGRVREVYSVPALPVRTSLAEAVQRLLEGFNWATHNLVIEQ